jgi:hypothetical protein
MPPAPTASRLRPDPCTPQPELPPRVRRSRRWLGGAGEAGPRSASSSPWTPRGGQTPPPASAALTRIREGAMAADPPGLSSTPPPVSRRRCCRCRRAAALLALLLRRDLHGPRAPTVVAPAPVHRRRHGEAPPRHRLDRRRREVCRGRDAGELRGRSKRGAAGSLASPPAHLAAPKEEGAGEGGPTLHVQHRLRAALLPPPPRLAPTVDLRHHRAPNPLTLHGSTVSSYGSPRIPWSTPSAATARRAGATTASSSSAVTATDTGRPASRRRCGREGGMGGRWPVRG